MTNTQENGHAPVEPRAFNVALHARTLMVLAHLQAAEVPIPSGPGNPYAVEMAREAGLEAFDIELIRAADRHDYVLAEILTRLQVGDTVGMSLVDFLPPDTVLALWHAMPPGKRRYLRAVFGTQAGLAPPEPHPTPKHIRDEALATLDRLLELSEQEINAAYDLLAMLVTSSQTVDAVLAEMNGTPGAEQVRAARAFTQDLLDAAEDDEEFDVTAWLDEHLPPVRPMPPMPTTEED